MPKLTIDTELFIAEFDAAIEAHTKWVQRVLRCAVLHEHPGEDVVSPIAHTLCSFGHWFSLNLSHFELVDLKGAQRITVVHKAMHSSIRSICQNIIDGKTGRSEDLDKFEKYQSELQLLLAKYKTKILSHSLDHDVLTGLPLRYNIDSDCKVFLGDAKRNKYLLYVALIDVDHFKLVNDTYGHQIGDKVLQHIALILKQAIRGSDQIYRFGGEEFLWLLRCKTIKESRHSARRVVKTIESHPFKINDATLLPLTVTIGLAPIGEGEDITNIISVADIALYKGKNNGRNQFVVAPVKINQ